MKAATYDRGVLSYLSYVAASITVLYIRLLKELYFFCK